MAKERVGTTKITREQGYLYFIDKNGNVARAQRGKKGSMVVAKAGITRAPGYLYYVSKSGTVERTRMSRGKRARAR